MANWNNLGGRGRVTDRRGLGGMAVGGGLGLTGLIIVVAFTLLSGGNITDVLSQIDTSQVQSTQVYSAEDFEGADDYKVFASTVLGSTDETWSQIFENSGEDYPEPELVLFRGSTTSACGGATSAVGPHYCSLDETIYLDETFFDELTRLDTEGGDVAEVYVMAHEVGHHVQHQLGLLDNARDNEGSIQLELQADCFAGLWAHSIRDLGVFGPGEINEAIEAAAAVGDDRVQTTVTGRVNPETWTHGSSADRVNWFNKGYETGLVSECDTGI